MSFTPLHDRVLVRRIEGEETTRGGIIIPDTAKEKPQEGEVWCRGTARGRRAHPDGREITFSKDVNADLFSKIIHNQEKRK